MTTTAHTSIVDAIAKIDSTRASLIALSESLYHVGQEKLGRLLHTEAKTLSEVSEILQHASDKMVFDVVAHANQASANMLQGVLAGIELGNKSPGGESGQGPA